MLRASLFLKYSIYFCRLLGSLINFIQTEYVVKRAYSLIIQVFFIPLNHLIFKVLFTDAIIICVWELFLQKIFMLDILAGALLTFKTILLTSPLVCSRFVIVSKTTFTTHLQHIVPKKASSLQCLFLILIT
jgi:hypothetical protein